MCKQTLTMKHYFLILTLLLISHKGFSQQTDMYAIKGQVVINMNFTNNTYDND